MLGQSINVSGKHLITFGLGLLMRMSMRVETAERVGRIYRLQLRSKLCTAFLSSRIAGTLVGQLALNP